MRAPTLVLVCSVVANAASGQQVSQSGAATARQAQIQNIAVVNGRRIFETFVAPSANRVYYASRDSLWIYDISTKQSRLVAKTPGSYNFHLSPKGDHVAFVRGDEKNDHEWIWSMPLDPTTGLAKGPAQRLSVTEGDFPRYSPDGKSLAFAADDSARQNLVVIPAAGGVERVVARPDDGIESIRWTPDSRTIYFVSPAHPRRGVPEATLSRVSLTGNASAPRVVMRMNDYFSVAGLSPNGTLTMVRPTTTAGLYSISDTAGRELARLKLPTDFRSISWMSDRKLLGYRAEWLSSIQVIPVDGGAPRELVPATFSVVQAHWSPDGKHIAVSGTENGKLTLLLMNADGSGKRAVARPDGGDNLWWSPDSRTIAFHATTAHGIDLLDVATGKFRHLMTSVPGRTIGQMDWRSDSKAIRYTERVENGGMMMNFGVVHETTLDGKDRVLRELLPGANNRPIGPLGDSEALLLADSGTFLFSLKDGHATRLSSQPNMQVGPSGRSPSGERLFALRSIEPRDFHQISIVNDRGEVKNVLSFPFYVGNGAMMRPLFHPDGRHLIISGTSENHDHAVYVALLDGGGT
ncbi:MAG TPA: hypothetical protein VI259_00040, partial [Gemmatimonadaceae bacterium]